VYNVGGNNERTNMHITKLLLKELGKGEDLIKYVGDRLGHDKRYAIDSSKIRQDLGWAPRYTFEDGIHETIGWYKSNQGWLQSVLRQEQVAVAAEALDFTPTASALAN
jgi:dTDP-glucose 4,6-dehydratase